MALNSDKEVRLSLYFEEGDPDRMDEKPVVADLKLDEHGLPLVPQPSDHKDDPLVKTIHSITPLPPVNEWPSRTGRIGINITSCSFYVSSHSSFNVNLEASI
jgi:hypothetical protein